MTWPPLDVAIYSEERLRREWFSSPCWYYVAHQMKQAFQTILKVLVLLEYPTTTTAGTTLRQLHDVKRQHVIETENKTIPQPPPSFVSLLAPMPHKQHGDGAEKIKSTAILGDKINTSPHDRASTRTSAPKTVSLSSFNSPTATQSANVLYFLRFAVTIPLTFFVAAILLYLYYIMKNAFVARMRDLARRRIREQESKEPREVEPEMLDMRIFKDKGPLVMQKSYSGDVKHALQDIRSMSLRTLVFDTAQNSLVKIGTEVEQIVGITEETQKSIEDDLVTCISVSDRRRKVDSNEFPISKRRQRMTNLEEDLATCISVSISENIKTRKKSSESTSAEKTLSQHSIGKNTTSSPPSPNFCTKKGGSCPFLHKK
ncbi:hypothetical protein V3C99_012516 [Haemonchus contortus]